MTQSKEKSITKAQANKNGSAVSHLTPEQLSKINIFGTIDKSKINLFSPPFSVRNDCKVGMWKLGDDDYISKTLDISIVAIRSFYGCLGKTNDTGWLQVWFVPLPGSEALPENTVCVTYIKTQSMSDFGTKVIQVMNETDPGLGVWSTSFDKKTGDYGDYYVLKWEWRERQTDTEWEQLKQISDFLSSSPVFFDANLRDTMVEVSSLTDPLALNEAHKQLKIIKESNAKVNDDTLNND